MILTGFVAWSNSIGTSNKTCKRVEIPFEGQRKNLVLKMFKNNCNLHGVCPMDRGSIYNSSEFHWEIEKSNHLEKVSVIYTSLIDQLFVILTY